MNIIIAPDSFKESLAALGVAQAIETGFKRVFPQAQYHIIPMADGGEGTVQSLIDATQGKLMQETVLGPLGNNVCAAYGLSGDGKTAIIEMAAASGLHLVPPEQRNPLLTSSFGTGQLMAAALNLGVQRIILGIGGSATNDGGAGMLQALGMKLLDKHGHELHAGGGALAQLAHVDGADLHPRLQQVQIEVACDVSNPLCGAQGASAIFGPQKGASPEMVQILDNNLRHFANVVAKDLGIDIATPAGTGAAGGMGGGVLLLPNVVLKKGVDIVMDTVQLRQKIQQADWVITGEGRMDGQTIRGKTPIGVARLAKEFGKPVIAIVGCVGADYEEVFEHGIDAVFPIIRQLDSLDNTLAAAQDNLIATAHNVAKVMQLHQGFMLSNKPSS